MLQNGLAAAFGFCAAMFLVLMLAPALARRISELTWRQATRVLPQSSEEIAAGRDHLRGQNAVEMRQLEMKMEAIAEKERQLRIGKQDYEDRIALLNDSVSKYEKSTSELELEGARLGSGLAESIQTNALLTTENADRDVRLAALSAQFSQLRGDYTRQTAALGLTEEAQRQAEQRFATARNEGSILRSKVSAAESELRMARTEAKRHEGDAKLANRKIAALEGKLERSIRLMAEAEEKLERRDAELKRLKEHNRNGVPSLVSQSPVSHPPLGATSATTQSGQNAKAVPQSSVIAPDARLNEPVESHINGVKSGSRKSDTIVSRITALRPALRLAPEADATERMRLKNEMVELAGRITAEAALQNPAIAAKIATLKPGSALADAILKHNKAAE